MHIVRSYLAYCTTPYFALWEVFRYQKRIRLRRIWECHDCHEGVVIPGTYMSIHGETVKIDSNAPEAHKKPWSKHWSYAFLAIIPLFHDSMIPTFHVGGTKPVSVKAAWFQYIIEIPRRTITIYHILAAGFFFLGALPFYFVLSNAQLSHKMSIHQMQWSAPFGFSWVSELDMRQISQYSADHRNFMFWQDCIIQA